MKLIILSCFLILFTLNNVEFTKSEVIYYQYNSACESSVGCNISSSELWSGGKLPTVNDTIIIEYSNGFQNIYIDQIESIVFGSLYIDAPILTFFLNNTSILEVTDEINLVNQSRITITSNGSVITPLLNITGGSALVLNSNSSITVLTGIYIDSISSIQAYHSASIYVGGVFYSNNNSMLEGHATLIIKLPTLLYGELSVSNLYQQSDLTLASNALLNIWSNYSSSQNTNKLIQQYQSTMLITDSSNIGIHIPLLSTSDNGVNNSTKLNLVTNRDVTLQSINHNGLIYIQSPVTSINSYPITTNINLLNILNISNTQQFYLNNTNINTLFAVNNNFTFIIDGQSYINSSLDFSSISTIVYFIGSQFNLNTYITANTIIIGNTISLSQVSNYTYTAITTTVIVDQLCNIINGNVIIGDNGILEISNGNDVAMTGSLTLDSGSQLSIQTEGTSLFVQKNFTVASYTTVSLELYNSPEDSPLTIGGQMVQLSDNNTNFVLSFLTSGLIELNDEYVLLYSNSDINGSFDNIYIFLGTSLINQNQYEISIVDDNQYILVVKSLTPGTGKKKFATWKMLTIAGSFIVFICIIVGIIYHRVRIREYKKYQLID